MSAKLNFQFCQTPIPGYYLNDHRCFEIPESRFFERLSMIELIRDDPHELIRAYEHKDGVIISVHSEHHDNTFYLCPMVRCNRCGTINEFYVVDSGKKPDGSVLHTKAMCNHCNRYIKFISRDLLTLNKPGAGINAPSETMIKTFMIGHLGKDAIVNNVNGKNVINFSIAHTEKWNDNNGQQQSKTTWVDCSYWTDKTGVAPYLLKGTQIFVEGTPDVKTFTRGDGTTGASLVMRVFSIQLLGSPNVQQSPAQQAAPVQQPVAQPWGQQAPAPVPQQQPVAQPFQPQPVQQQPVAQPWGQQPAAAQQQPPAAAQPYIGQKATHNGQNYVYTASGWIADDLPF
jgi:single-strand DNA-binding protein